MAPLHPNRRPETPLCSTTEDSRFHGGHQHFGLQSFFNMYSANISVEADGLAYSELNILRSMFLEPFVVRALVSNSVIAYIFEENRIKPYCIPLTILFCWTMLSHSLRIISSITILLIELTVWPVRVFLGALLGPIARSFSAGYLYALTYELFARSGCTTRRIKVKNSVYCRIRPVPASWLGKVLWFQTVSYSDASYIVSVLKLQQRCGTGPEGIWLDGRNVFVSWWKPWTITSFLRGNDIAWNLWDVNGMKWRRTVFEMSDDQQSDIDVTSDGFEQSQHEFVMRPIKFSSTCKQGILGRRKHSIILGLTLFGSREVTRSVALSIRDEHCGEISTICELEQYYESPLGWNKYYRMKKEGNKIRVPRPDRRLMSHLLALVSCLSLYFWYKDSSRGRFGLFIDLQALILASYAFITAYAGEVLLGPYSEVVDAKSARYGIIVTRAIEEGYVRGFHVPNGNWLIYKNGEEGSEVHEITKTEINATCNSIVTNEGKGMKIRVIGCDEKELEPLDWVGEVER